MHHCFQYFNVLSSNSLDTYTEIGYNTLQAETHLGKGVGEGLILAENDVNRIVN